MSLLARVALGVLLLERLARASEPELAELDYDPGGLDECPEEGAFRIEVVKRLGRDPFSPGALRKIRVRLGRNGAVLSALVSVEEAAQSRGERRIETRASCTELASGAALAVSIAIDPLVALAGGSQAPSADLPAKPAPEAPARSLPAPSPAAGPPTGSRVRRPTRIFLRGGARAFAGLVPALGVGPSVGFGAQWGSWSLSLDGFSVLPRTERQAGSPRAASVSWLGLEVSPCVHLVAARGCALFAAGRVSARGEGVDEPRRESTWQALAGFGLGYSLFVGRFSFTPSAAALARLTMTELAFDDETLWTTPRWVGSLRLEIGYDIARSPREQP
jgi:hypothetical protein